MRVLLFGAGRYGNDLVGRKYVNGELKANLIGVIDPNIDCIRRSTTYSLKSTPTYHSIREVPSEVFRDCVADIALVPEIVLDSFKKLVNCGVKKFILPKPVTTNERDFNEFLDINEGANAKSLVASNWHYADITTMTKALLDKLTGKTIETPSKLTEDFAKNLNGLSTNYKITKVEIEYNKKNETLAIDPPLQEFPHALQIAYSTGCTDLKDIGLIMDKELETKSRVNVILKEDGTIQDGIFVNSDLRMKELDKKRERILKVYLDNNVEKAIVTVDYDAQFTPEGECIKSQNISYESLNSPEMDWNYEVCEDNIETMYSSMFKSFENGKNNALTLNQYQPIASILYKAEELWKNLQH